MKLVAKYDIEAPVAYVYTQLTDFEAWERMALRRGVEVTRTDRLTRPGAGMQWQVSFALRGKERRLSLRIAAFSPTSHLAIALASTMFDGEVVLDLLDLAPDRTRCEVRLDVKPRTIGARIYVQTLRLARKKVDRSFAQRVAQLAIEIEDRHRRTVNR
jgi:hypothetical protein